MKTTNSFYWTFIDTLILNVATIAAIVVGVCQFLIRAWNENNGNAKVRQFVIRTATMINNITGHIQTQLSTDVPVVKVARKSPKRR